MNPVQELRAAATKLRETAAKATRGPWVINKVPPYTDPLLLGESDDPENYTIAGTVDVGEGDQAWMVLTSPVLAGPLAALLDEVADEAEKYAAKGWGNSADEVATGWPLKVARALNGSAR